jgi:hypothetical protein
MRQKRVTADLEGLIQGLALLKGAAGGYAIVKHM